MLITAYRYERDPPALKPALSTRKWMDDTYQGFAYRCIPLSVANSSGYDILMPETTEITWGGEDAPSSMRIATTGRVKNRCSTHFGHGILTFMTGYLFMTPPGWALWARGSPNTVKDGIVALDGLVETEWSPYTFTMNWRFTRPGKVVFEAGESFCFITPVPHQQLDDFELEIKPLVLEKDLSERHVKWVYERDAFNKRIAAKEPAAIAQAWQKFYARGYDNVKTDEKTKAYHVTKRRMRMKGA